MSDYSEKKVLHVELRCGCGATMFLEWPFLYTSDVLPTASELSKAWIAVHGQHHVEPAKKATP